MFNVKLLLLVSTLAATGDAVQAQTKTHSSTRYSTTDSNTGSGITWLNVDSDSLNDPRKLITLYKNNQVYKIKTDEGKITELFIDEKKIAEADYPQYQPMVKDLLEKIRKDQERAEADRKRAEKDRARAEVDRAVAEKYREAASRDRERAEVDRRKAEKDREQARGGQARAEKDREHATHQRETVEAYQQEAQKHRAEAEADRKQAEVHRQQAAKDHAQAEKHRTEAEAHREHAEKDRARAVVDRQRAEVDRQRAEVDRKRAEEDRKMMEQMIEELISEKIISDREELRVVQLSEEALIINDTKQPAALHQRLKGKYLKKKGGRITYVLSPNRTYFDVDNK